MSNSLLSTLFNQFKEEKLIISFGLEILCVTIKHTAFFESFGWPDYVVMLDLSAIRLTLVSLL